MPGRKNPTPADEAAARRAKLAELERACEQLLEESTKRRQQRRHANAKRRRGANMKRWHGVNVRRQKDGGERQQRGENARSRRLGIAVVNTIGARTQRPGDRRCGDGAHRRECHRAEAPHNTLGV